MEKMLQLGPRSIPMNGLGRIKIQADGPFVVYETNDEDKAIPVGPLNDGDLFSNFMLSGKQTGIMVETQDHITWKIIVEPYAPHEEILDLTPVETTVEGPQTIREEMKEYVRTILAMQEEERQGAEDFDEANDFDIDDDHDLDLDWDSKYELMEMVDEVLAEDAPQEPEEPADEPSEESEPSPTDPPPKDA